MIELREQQWQAAKDTSCHLLVSAGAGTGRTRTVIGRVLYLLGVEVNGERIDRPITLDEIAAITGLTEGAVKMRHLRALQRLNRRLKQELGEDPT